MGTPSGEDVLDFLARHETVLTAALRTYAERLAEAAQHAQAAYETVKDDPAKAAAQDRSLITTQGLRQAAELFATTADQASAALVAMAELRQTEGDQS